MGNLPFSDRVPPVSPPMDTEGPEAMLEPDSAGWERLPTPEKLVTQSFLAQRTAESAPGACPHLYRIKCFVY